MSLAPDVRRVLELIARAGMVHAFWSLGGAIREAARSMERAAAFLRRELQVR
jgi:acetyl esterase/lipase